MGDPFNGLGSSLLVIVGFDAGTLGGGGGGGFVGFGPLSFAIFCIAFRCYRVSFLVSSPLLMVGLLAGSLGPTGGDGFIGFGFCSFAIIINFIDKQCVEL